MYFSKQKRITSIVICIIVIMALACSVFIGSIGENSTQAAVTNNVDVISTDLLLATRDTSVGGKVFNAAALDELYAKLAGENAVFSDVEDNAREQKSTYTNDSVKSIHSGMDSEDIRVENGNNIVVKIDGKEWIVTALTTTDNSNGAHIVLTLLFNGVTFTSAWGKGNMTTSSTLSSDKYPSNMYSSSYVRASLLNGIGGESGGVKYSADRNSLVPFVDTDLYGVGGYPFNIYLDGDASGNITDFILKPRDVLYQQYENLYDLQYTTNRWFTAQNDASKNAIDSSKWSVAEPIQHKIGYDQGYFDWGYDNLWLPSMSEVGQNGSSNVVESGGVWNLDVSQRAVGSAYWLRSGMFHNLTGAQFISDAGGIGGGDVTTTNSIRPAFNLDLTLAEQSSAYVFDVPADFSVEYSGDPQGVEGQEWYTSSFASIVDVEYYVKDSQSPISKPTVVGDYMAKLTLKGDNVWSDNKTGSERLINFSITQKKIDFPKFIGDSQKPYNGGMSIDGKVEFQVEYRDEYLQYVEITKPSGAQYGDVTFNSNSYKVTAYDVGKYELDVKLKDPVNTKWKTNNNKLEFEVTKAPINLSITDPSQNNALTGAVGDKLTVYIDIDQSTIIHNGNTLDIKITASSQGVPTLPISEVITLDENDRQVPVTIDLSDLMGNKQYTIGVSTESGNYEPKVVSSTTLDVTPAPTRTVLTWNLYSDGLLVRGQYKDADISQSETAVTLPSNLTYNGKRYTFKVSAPTGYRVDSDYGVGGFLVEPSTSGNNNVGINADTYTTKIRLIENASGNKQEYSISWTVVPAKFDLSQVKWQYDGQLPYNKVSGSEAILDPKTLPVGLDPHYSNNTGTTVGTSGTAYVT
ncbi:MAG: hypothetical protein K2N53_03645, partial [Clostridia bacterium]|nr:hypothetical protein [Clostridia bacterium]